MNSFRLEMKLGSLVYLGIFVFALVLRINHLGTFPLTDEEALSALRAAQGTSEESPFYFETPNAVAQPSYEVLTRIGFQIFGADDFFARLVPALSGVVIVLTPLLARKRLGWGRTALMAFLLAVCPVFVTISRTASGVSLSALGMMSFIMAILGLEEENHNRHSIIAGIGLGFSLASGPSIFNAILALALSLFIWRLLVFRSQEVTRLNFIPRGGLFQITWVAAVAILFFATGMGLFMNGISGLFDSIAYWFRSWSLGSPFASLTLLTMIPTYMPALFLLGIYGGWTSFRKGDTGGLFAVIFTIVGLMIIMLFPGRQPHDLIWIALPLSFLGSVYLESFTPNIIEGRINLWVIAIVMLIILFVSMAYLQLSSTASRDQLINPVTALMTILIFMTLIVVILVFFGLGWSWTSAKLSLILASLLLVIILGISALWRLNFRSRVMTATELWRNRVPTAGMEIMLETIKTTSQTTEGTDHGLDIELMGDAPYSLVWALRDMSPSVGQSVGESMSSPVVLAPQSEMDLVLQDNYIGQTIAIREEWDWNSALPPEFLKWWIKRQPPIASDEWLILIRQDIALLGES